MNSNSLSTIGRRFPKTSFSSVQSIVYISPSLSLSLSFFSLFFTAEIVKVGNNLMPEARMCLQANGAWGQHDRTNGRQKTN